MSNCGCEVNGQLIVGQEVQFTATVVDINGNPVNPDTVTISVKQPNNSVVVVTPVSNPATGTFTATFVLDQAGDYVWQFLGNGSFNALGEQAFTVIESAFS